MADYLKYKICSIKREILSITYINAISSGLSEMTITYIVQPIIG